ncbi:protease modulator HflK [Verrucomicrobia bacterium]|nr:protease modulator HflK [Verrucomicrobiota bacterium]
MTNTQVMTPSARIIRGAFSWTDSNRYQIGMGVLALALVSVFFGGFYKVKIGESGALRRFGSLLDSKIQPGLHWRVPLWVDEVDIRSTEEIHRIEVDGQISPELPMLTGDINFANAKLAVQYKISDLDQFLFDHENAVEVMTAIVRGAFIDTLGTMFIDMVLATEKRFVEDQVLKQAAIEIAALELGVELSTISLRFIEPPAEAIPAFRAVNDARLNRETLVNETHKRVENLLARVRGDAQRVTEDAGAQAIVFRNQALGDSGRFLAMLEQKITNPEQTEETVYWDAVRKILAHARIILLSPDQNPNLAVNLIETPLNLPPGVNGLNQLGAGHVKEANSSIQQSEAAAHPTLEPIHGFGVLPDRLAGMGTHNEGSQVHAFPVPRIDGVDLPTHVLGVSADVSSVTGTNAPLPNPKSP